MVKILDDAVEQFASLPGIGRKTALRLALHLLKLPKENVVRFGQSFITLAEEVRYCTECNMISDSAVCEICSDKSRDRSIICVVESHMDLLSIEATGEYRGLYFVLGGIISPIDGVGPEDLPFDRLLEKASNGEVKEVILVLSTGMEGETTSYYIYKLLSRLDVKVTTLARGVGFGDELEYTDQLTLGRSIKMRLPLTDVL